MGEARQTLPIGLFGEALAPVSAIDDAKLHGRAANCSGLPAPPAISLAFPGTLFSLTGLASKTIPVLISSMKLTKVRQLISVRCPLI
jgi:hypothetical protein